MKENHGNGFRRLLYRLGVNSPCLTILTGMLFIFAYILCICLIPVDQVKVHQATVLDVEETCVVLAFDDAEVDVQAELTYQDGLKKKPVEILETDGARIRVAGLDHVTEGDEIAFFELEMLGCGIGNGFSGQHTQ